MLKVYIGETRRLETRLEEHKDPCVKDKSALAEYTSAGMTLGHCSVLVEARS